MEWDIKPRNKPITYDQLIYKKRGKNTWKKDNLFNK